MPENKRSQQQMSRLRTLPMGDFLLEWNPDRFYQVGRYVLDRERPRFKCDTKRNVFYRNEAENEKAGNIMDFLSDCEQIVFIYVLELLEAYLAYLMGGCVESEPFKNIYWERKDGSVGSWGSRNPSRGNDAKMIFDRKMENLERTYREGRMSEWDYRTQLEEFRSEFEARGGENRAV
ncbi:MAG: hypothetical protein IJA19_04510 [Clostridia bacterium]|nr:hypothetical protein [Clostridia bacterium]